MHFVPQLSYLVHLKNDFIVSAYRQANIALLTLVQAIL